ncbi:LysR family transcriptional regulator [Nitratireductor soli]|uniref:LysR family transcriptional regulator n=1 Tax=Nitratireductor soli TaxID=1670619 RepID=UPI00065E6E58|nr:LysR family transcriptional regulator [Nitratireductor soli]
MNSAFEWNDLRLILAVGDAGSLSGAGRKLQVSHATVFRRLGAIERRIGVALFERTRGGYVATTAGEEAVSVARRLESEIHALEQAVIGRDLRPSGTVSVTTTDTLHYFLLGPILAGFCARYPEIDLDVIVSNHLFDLSQREADVALRPAMAPAAHLVGRKLGIIRQSVYGRRGLARTGGPAWREKSLPWVGPDHHMAYTDLEQWMARHGADQRCRLRVNSVLGMHAAVKAGIGVAVLPDYLARGDAELTRLDGVGELDVDLWLLTHPTLRRAARISAFADFVSVAVRHALSAADAPD